MVQRDDHQRFTFRNYNARNGVYGAHVTDGTPLEGATGAISNERHVVGNRYRGA
jgi:hypothetical protein